MTNSKTVNTVFGYAVDQASLQRVQSAQKALKAEQKQLIDLFNTPTTSVGPADLNRKLVANQLALRKATADAEALRKKLVEVGNTRVAPSISIPGAPLGGGVLATQAAADTGNFRQTNAISAFGRELRNLPSTPIPGTGIATDAVGNILRIAGPALTALTGSMTALLTAALPITAALAALAATFVVVGAKSEEGAKVLRGLIAAQEKYFDLINTGTRDQIEAARDAAQVEREGLERRIAINKRFFEGIEDEFGQTLGPVVRGVADIFNLSGAQELRKDTQELEQRLLSAGIAAGVLTAELESTGAAARTAAEATRILNGGDEGEVFKRDIEGRIELAQVLAGLNQENAESQLKTFEERRNQLNAEFNTLKSFEPLFNNLADTQTGPLRTVALEFIARVADVENELTGLNFTLIPAATDTNRLAEAADALAESSKRAVAALDAQIARDTQQNQLLRTGTSQQIDERIAALNDENQAILASLPALREQAATSEDAAKKVTEYEARLRVLNEEFGELSRLRPDVAARQFREETAKLVNELNADVTKIAQARDARIAQIESDRTDKETQAYAERTDAILEIQRKTADDERKQAEDHQKALARIIRKGNAAQANAIASRDALAFFLAKQSKDEQIAEEKENNADRLKEIKARSDEEYRITNKRLKDTLDAAKDAARDAVALERSKAKAEIATRRAQYTAEFNALVSVVNGHATAWNSITGYAQQAVNFIQRLTGQAQTQLQRQVIQPTTVTLSGGTAAERFAAYQRSQGVPGFAGGGYPPLGRPVMVGENGPELVTFGRQARIHSAAETQRMGSGAGVTVNIGNIEGASRREIRREVDKRLNDTLKAAGVPN